MRVKTSVTLPSALLEAIDRVEPNRSAFLEKAAELYLSGVAKTERDARDLAIIRENAEYLNEEARDVLEYQDVPS